MVSEQKPSEVMDADAMDDDILDLLEVVEVGKGVAEGSSDNAEADFAANLDSMLDDLESQESEDMPFPDPTPVDHEVDLNESLDLPSMDDLDNLLAELGAEAPATADKSHDTLAGGDDLDGEGASLGAGEVKASIEASLDEALANLDELDVLDEMSRPEAPEPLDFDDELDDLEASASPDVPDSQASLDASAGSDMPDTPDASDIADISDVFASFEAQNATDNQNTDDAVASQEADLLAEILGQTSVETPPVASPETSPEIEAEADILGDVFEAAVAKMESEDAPQPQEAIVGEIGHETIDSNDLDAFDALQAASLSDTPDSPDIADAPDFVDSQELDGKGASARDDLPLDVEGLGTLEAPLDPFESAMAAAAQAEDGSADAVQDEQDVQPADQSPSTAVVGTRLDEDVNELDALLDEMLSSPPVSAPVAEVQQGDGAGQSLNDDIHDIFERLDNLESSPSTQQLFERCTSLEEALAHKDEVIASLEQRLLVQGERMAQLEGIVEEQGASLTSFTADMDKMVAAAAAKVIREEIAALIESLQGGE